MKYFTFISPAHLSPDSCTIDYLPRSEAFWFRGPINPDHRMVTKKEGREKAKAKQLGRRQDQLDQDKIHEPYDRAIQVHGYRKHGAS